MSTYGYDTPGGSAPGGAAPGGAAPGSPAPGFPGGSYRQAPHDPTAVMGRRIGAWAIDALLFFLLMFVFSPFEGAFAKYERLPDEMSATEACEILQDRRGVSTCVTVDEGMFGGHPPQDRIYYVEDWVSAVGLFAAVAWFVLVYVIWQGLTGATPGKTLLKLRVVDESGGPPGMGKSAVRSIMWVVDGAPWVVPLVGFVTGLTSAGHRRVGDRAAKTFVVDQADQGRPVPMVAASPAPEPVYHSPQPAGPGPSGFPVPAMPPTAPPTAPPTITEPVGPAHQPATPPAGPRADETALPPFEPSRPPFPQGGPAPPPTREPGDGGLAGPGSATMPEPDASRAAEAGGAPAEGEGASDSSSLPSWAAPPTRAPDPFGRPEPPEAPASSGAPADPSSPAPDASGSPFGSPTAPPGEPAEPTAPTQPVDQAGPAGASEPATQPEPTAPPVIPVEPARPAIEGTAAAPEADQPAEQPTYQPQWDTARGAYIQWDPNRNAWLQWDDDAKEWHAIS